MGTNLVGTSSAFPVQIQGPLSGSNDISSYSWNFTGTLSSAIDSEGYTVNALYDNLDRPSKFSYLDGTSEQILYNKLDAVLFTDRLGRTTTDSYDSLDELVCEIDPLGRKTSYCWCTCGSLAALTDPANNTTIWQHDLEGRIVAQVYPDESELQVASCKKSDLSNFSKVLELILNIEPLA